MSHITIHSEECKGCRLCIDVCKKDCLHIGSNINKIGYQYIEFLSDTCTACGNCYYACPELGAITVIKDDKKAKENE